MDGLPSRVAITLFVAAGLVACPGRDPIYLDDGAGGGGAPASTTSSGTSSTSSMHPMTSSSSGSSGGGGGGLGGQGGGGLGGQGGGCGTCMPPDACHDAGCAGPQCVIGPIAGMVDQKSFGFDGSLGIQTSVEQTFVVGATGSLTGIEISIASCNAPAPPNSFIQLTVVDAVMGTPLGIGTLSGTQLGMACAPPVPDPTALGPGYIDLSGACLHVTQGQTLQFVITPTGFPAGTCNMATALCATGRVGQPCDFDQLCDFTVEIDYSESDTYPNGALTRNGGTPTGGDLVFKTYVQP